MGKFDYFKMEKVIAKLESDRLVGILNDCKEANFVLLSQYVGLV